METLPRHISQEELDKTLRHHVWSAMGIGLIPLPVAEIPALIAVQLHLLKQLAAIYDIPFFQGTARNLLSSLAGGTVPSLMTPYLVPSLLKIIPGMGQAAGAVTMSMVAGATTYAIGKVFIQHFASGGTFLTFDPDKVKEYYANQVQEGHHIIHEMKSDEAKTTSNTPRQSKRQARSQEPAPSQASQSAKNHTRRTEQKRHTISEREPEKHPMKHEEEQQTTQEEKPELQITNPFLRFIINDATVLTVIVINAAVLVLAEFPAFKIFMNEVLPQIDVMGKILPAIDYGCSIFFVVEGGLKISILGFRRYWSSGWNRLDFLVVLSTLPLLIDPFIPARLDAFSFVSLLRLGRFLRFLRATRVFRVMRAAKAVWKGAGVAQAPVMIGFILTGLFLAVTTFTAFEGLIMWSRRLYSFSMTLTGAWLLIKIYHFIHDEYLLPLALRTESGFDDIILPLIRTVFGWFVGLLALVMSVKTLGFDVGALLAGLGLVGFALAIAAREILSNLLGGAAIFAKRLFRTGDRIELAGWEGKVKTIDLFSTELIDPDGKRITIPNKTFAEDVVVNAESQTIYPVKGQLRLRYDSSIDQIRTALDILKHIPERLDHVEQECWISFEAIGEDAFNIEYRYDILPYRHNAEGEEVFRDEYDKMSTVKTRIHLEMMRAFEETGIKLSSSSFHSKYVPQEDEEEE